MLQARLGLAWERLARVWMPLLLALGVLSAAALWGALEPLPPAIRNGVSAAVMAGAAGLAIVNLVRLRWPSRTEAAQRVELDYGGEPDELAAGNPELWAAHLDRIEASLARARAGRMGAGIAAADPWALRYALTIAVALGLWAFGPERGVARLAEAFEPAGVAGDYGQAMLARAGHAAGDGMLLAAAALDQWAGPAAPELSPAEFQRASIQSRAQIPGKPRILPAASRP